MGLYSKVRKYVDTLENTNPTLLARFPNLAIFADLNNDGVVNIQDLVVVANALNDIAAALGAQQSQASTVKNWLHLARQNATGIAQTAIPEGCSYERGIQVLEQLTRALVPEKTALLANYPNPFNPETWIPYQLAKAADVTVNIYASNGTVVRTLALGHQNSIKTAARECRPSLL